MDKVVCDRCGDDIHGNDRRNKVGRLGAYGFRQMADLCPTCFAEYERWLKGDAHAAVDLAEDLERQRREAEDPWVLLDKGIRVRKSGRATRTIMPSPQRRPHEHTRRGAC